MIPKSKFGEKRASQSAIEAQPLASADRIERFGHALNARQLAAFLAVSTIIVYKLARKGLIPSFKVGTCIRFCPKAIAGWLRAQ